MTGMDFSIYFCCVYLTTKRWKNPLYTYLFGRFNISLGYSCVKYEAKVFESPGFELTLDFWWIWKPSESRLLTARDEIFQSPNEYILRNFLEWRKLELENSRLMRWQNLKLTHQTKNGEKVEKIKRLKRWTQHWAYLMVPVNILANVRFWSFLDQIVVIIRNNSSNWSNSKYKFDLKYLNIFQ